MKAVLFLMLACALPACAQKAAGVGAAPVKSPPQVVPLADADKVVFLSLLHKQDGLVIEQRDHQIAMADIDKKLEAVRAEISKKAQALADAGKIDVNSLVLDLDRLAWVSKDITK
jgi:hypothetical protein